METPTAAPEVTATSVGRGNPTVAPGSDRPETRRRRVSRAFYAAGAAVALSTLLPWVSVLGVFNAHLTGVQILVLLVFAAAYAGAGYLAKAPRVTRAVPIGAWVVNSLLGLWVVIFYNSFEGAEGIVSPAIGVFVAGIGVIVGIVATIQLHRSRGRHAVSTPLSNGRV